jgi:SAM-dependent methyltransferase
MDSILPLIPGLIEELESGIEVLDVGCGAGRALNLMVEAFPKSRFTGYDISEEATATGRAAGTGQCTVRSQGCNGARPYFLWANMMIGRITYERPNCGPGK